MSSKKREDAIKVEVDIMEKEIIYLKGIRREKARKAYFKLLNKCIKNCGLDEPIYLKRS
jgi:hypothetical protein